ncbi:hypothetical protein NliqN6_3025 [Naganishia liquefaciens]|uniref:Uncharacterized protein n=1 Tax=Naganishia liquefaciens TaxID=104408 RepID=A0A8H3TT48_9TREE|nr:hypothetical protein NliqN6_3025 [Naganishia liquefaciens]
MQFEGHNARYIQVALPLAGRTYPTHERVKVLEFQSSFLPSGRNAIL